MSAGSTQCPPCRPGRVLGASRVAQQITPRLPLVGTLDRLGLNPVLNQAGRASSPLAAGPRPRAALRRSLHYLRFSAPSAVGQPPQFVRRQVAATPADKATVLTQIRAVDAAIRSHEFSPGCDQCRWCRLWASSPA
jgi:hypothetical protein